MIYVRAHVNVIGISISQLSFINKADKKILSPHLIHSEIGETLGNVLAKVKWTFVIGESHIGENLTGEILEPLLFEKNVQLAMRCLFKL